MSPKPISTCGTWGLNAPLLTDQATGRLSSISLFLILSHRETHPHLLWHSCPLFWQDVRLENLSAVTFSVSQRSWSVTGIVTVKMAQMKKDVQEVTIFLIKNDASLIRQSKNLVYFSIILEHFTSLQSTLLLVFLSYRNVLYSLNVCVR